MARLKGCLFLVVVLLIIYMIGKYGGTPKTDELPTLAVLALPTSRPDVRDTPTEPPGVTIIPTVVINRSGFVTITPAPGTAYPTATITDTPVPLATATAPPQLTPMDLQIMFTVSSVNLRSCPATSCAIVEKIPGGAGLGVSGVIDGEEVDAGNPHWYKVEHSESEEYAYSRFLSKAAPAALQPNAQVIATNQAQPQQPTSAPVQQVIYPDNCKTAVAMGLSPTQAAQAGLDRDGDGEACYGN